MPEENKRVRSRKMAREAALQALYAVAAAGQELLHATDAAIEHQRLADSSAEFARGVADGVASQRSVLEPLVEPHLKKGWGLDRIAVVDRIILLIAAYELYHLPGMPPKVSITEAVRLAKKYSTSDSASYINGVLAKVLEASPKAQWDPSMEEAMEPDEEVPEEDEAEVVEEIEEGSEAHEEITKAGAWVIRSDE